MPVRWDYRGEPEDDDSKESSVDTRWLAGLQEIVRVLAEPNFIS